MSKIFASVRDTKARIAARIGISRKARLKIKALVSVVLFASLFIFGKVDLGKSLQAALSANPWFLGMAAIAFACHIALNAYRWQLLARAVGFSNSLPQMIQYYYVGMFFNLFLPSTVGGDVSRCYCLSRGTGKYANAFYSVVADRTAGIAVLFLMASCGIAFGPGGNGLPWQLKGPIFAGTALIFGLLPLAPQLSKLLLGSSNWITRQLTSSCASVYWTDKRLITTCLLWSAFLQLIMVGAHIGIGLALGLTSVPFWYYLVFYPSVAVLGFITPSFNGIGIREWAYTYFLMLVGVDRAHALTYAITWLAYTTLMSLAGGIVYLAGHFKKIPAAELEQIQNATTGPAGELVA